MGAKEDKENIDGLYPKPKVVILAEDATETGNDEHPMGFPSQAFTWKKDHPEFDVHVYPFYSGWKGNEMRDVVKKIDTEVVGNFDIAFMGHSGRTMGGVPISEPSTINSRVSNIRSRNIKQSRRKLGAYQRDNPKKPWQNTDDRGDNFEDISDETIALLNSGEYFKEEGVEAVLEEYVESKTIADYIRYDLGDRVNEVIVGGCSQGKGHPETMQSLSSETGKNVTCQYSGRWGTGAITETGESPREKFFVSGKYKEVGAIQFKPVPEDLQFTKTDPADRSFLERSNPKMLDITEDYDPEMLEKRKQSDKSINRHHRMKIGNARQLTMRAQSSARDDKQLLENIRNPRKLPENVADWTVDDILYEQWNLENNNPRSVMRLIDIMGVNVRRKKGEFESFLSETKEYEGVKSASHYVASKGKRDYKKHLDDLLYELDYKPTEDKDWTVEGYVEEERPEDNYYSNVLQRESSDFYMRYRDRKKYTERLGRSIRGEREKKHDFTERFIIETAKRLGISPNEMDLRLSGEEEPTTERTVGTLSDYFRQYD